MNIQQLLQNPDYKQKFVLEKLIQEYLGYNRETMRLRLHEEINEAHLIQIQQAYHAYTVDKKPLEYILGHVDFFGNSFYVNENTLIPRPETEYMIEAITQWRHEQCERIVIEQDDPHKSMEQKKKSELGILLDIGTGCGVLGISVLLQNPNFYRQAFFSDISSDALRVAQNNYDNLVDRKDVDVRFIQSDLLDFFVSGDIVPQMPITLVANLPYIPDETFDNNALENVQKWEPRLAFVGGNDGLDLYRKMFKQLRNSQLDFVKLDITMFLEMMTRQVEILKSEFGDWLQFEEVKTFHFNIRIVKVFLIY